jgi:hypothetical protein
MYTNIPTVEVKQIIKDILDRDYHTKLDDKRELLGLINVILEQNYIQFNDHFYKQHSCLAMGAPTSAILAETFIQFLEHNIIYKILEKHHIIDYYRYVDDILIIYNSEHTNIYNTLQEFNTAHHNLKFTLETETQNTINYLDITINKQQDKLTFGIYRKPTTTNSIIHNSSCHPNEHKRSAITYLNNRMNTYHLTPENKAQEYTIIKEILTNNGYNNNRSDIITINTTYPTQLKNKMGNFYIPRP